MPSDFRIFNPAELHKPMGYSHIAEITSGKLIYIAGQVAIDPSGKIVGDGDFRAQVKQVFANLAAALKAVGVDFHHVVKFNCYCVEKVDPEQMAIFREIRDLHVNTAHPPTSTFVYVSRLVRPEWLIEVEAVAVV
ncbi:MAG TPA: RidA family protein [Bryobacteraceae bacterium]|nr:RidA family protein [Bryobacteraceae bacterium]